MPLKDHGVFDLFNFEYLDIKNVPHTSYLPCFITTPTHPPQKKSDANYQNV